MGPAGDGARGLARGGCSVVVARGGGRRASRWPSAVAQRRRPGGAAGARRFAAGRAVVPDDDRRVAVADAAVGLHHRLQRPVRGRRPGSRTASSRARSRCGAGGRVMSRHDRRRDRRLRPGRGPAATAGARAQTERGAVPSPHGAGSAYPLVVDQQRVQRVGLQLLTPVRKASSIMNATPTTCRPGAR